MGSKFLLLGLFLGASLSTPAAAQITGNDCRTCHSGATKGLALSVHPSLVQLTNSCLQCHDEAAAHALSAVNPRTSIATPGAVRSSSCKSCHGEVQLDTRLAAHSWQRHPRPAPTGDQPTPGQPTTGQTPSSLAPGPLVLSWEGQATVGYRFVDVTGNRERFETDFNLDEGLRLSDLEFDTRFDSDLLDRVHVTARNIADPYEHVSGTLSADGSYAASGEFRRSRYKYRASGDYHRVDRKEQSSTYDLRLPMADGSEVFGSFTRSNREGFWLTNRIGNQNLTPLQTVTGVASPRRVASDEGRLGLTAHLGDTTLTLVGE